MMEQLRRQNAQEDNIIKDVKNLFRPENEIDDNTIKYKNIRHF